MWDNSKPGYSLIAQRLTALSPGAFDITAAISRSGSLPLRLHLVCIGGARQFPRVASLRLDGGRARLNVPARDCDAQMLQIAAPRGKGELTDLQVVPLRKAG